MSSIPVSHQCSWRYAGSSIILWTRLYWLALDCYDWFKILVHKTVIVILYFTGFFSIVTDAHREAMVRYNNGKVLKMLISLIRSDTERVSFMYTVVNWYIHLLHLRANERAIKHLYILRATLIWALSYSVIVCVCVSISLKKF